MRHLPGLSFCATMLLACGRSVLSFDPGPGGTAGAGGSTSPTTTTASSSSSSSSSTTTGAGGTGPDAGPPPCVGWTVALSTPIAITDPAADTRLDSVVADGDRVLIATSNTDMSVSPDPTWRVRVVAGDLSSVGQSQVVLQHPTSVSSPFSPMSLAARDGHWGGIAFANKQNLGCRFVAIDADGKPASPPVQIGPHDCYGLDVSPSGYTALTKWGYSTSLLGLDPSGVVVSDTSIVTVVKQPGQPTLGDVVDYGKRLRLDDGTMVLTGFKPGPSPGYTAVMQHFSANGDPLGSQVDIGPTISGGEIHVASMGTSLLTARTSFSSPGEVRVRVLDVDGNALGPDNVVAPADGTSVGAVSLVAVDDGALVAWAKSPLGEKLEVQAVTDTGASKGAPFSVLAPPGRGFSHTGDGNVVMVRAAGGVLVAFEARDPDPEVWDAQVFVTRLACAE